MIAVETRGVGKSFPGVRALDDVSISVRRGAVHALMGENGAGKSTLGRILAGLYHPDEGEVLLFGLPVRFSGPHDAMDAGVAIVHQELSFCENLSVAENLTLDAPPTRWPLIDRAAMRETASQWLAQIGANVNPDVVVGSLAIGKRQLVQIAGAIGRGAKILVFDEPTSSLTRKETLALFEQIRRLKADGVTCIYVSHRMDELFEICDDVTVLRDGKHIGTKPVSQVDRAELVRMMIGREIETPSHSVAPQGDVALSARGLSSPGKLFDVDLAVRKGEVVGLAGLIGSGRTELAEAIFGLDPHATGVIEIDGQALAGRNPNRAMAAGVGLVPEDRKRQGLVLGMNCRENLTLSALGRLAKWGVVRSRLERRLAERYFGELSIRAPGPDAPVVGLSGGNQQKVVLARWLAADCDVLILDEPTRGVDVGSKAEIHALMRGLAAQGKSILVISSELPELLVVCNRIVVMREGRVAGHLAAEEASEESLMRLMSGVAA